MELYGDRFIFSMKSIMRREVRGLAWVLCDKMWQLRLLKEMKISWNLPARLRWDFLLSVKLPLNHRFAWFVPHLTGATLKRLWSILSTALWSSELGVWCCCSTCCYFIEEQEPSNAIAVVVVVMAVVMMLTDVARRRGGGQAGGSSITPSSRPCPVWFIK